MINGAMTYCKFLSEQLNDFGHSVTVVSREGSWLSQNLNSAIRVNSNHMDRKLKTLKQFANWIRREQFDVIHTHMSRAHSFGVLMKWMTGVPVVATAHNCTFQLHWRMNDFVLANSQSTFDQMQRINRVPVDRLKKVYCFTDLQKFRDVSPQNVTRVKRQMRLTGKEFLVGVVGEVIPRKGQLHLFEALKQVVAQVPNLKLVLIGRFHRNEAYIKKMRAIQIKDELFTRVKWLGYRYNIQDFMHAFDLCVVPSLQEPLGLVALESFAAGTPVVATEVGGLPEIVQHENNGLLVPPANPKALAQSIIRMAKDKKMREQFGNEGLKTVVNHFDPAKLARDVEAVYRQVTQTSRARVSA
jgi:glycosyltransferase involved in cell wall biosynthesis